MASGCYKKRKFEQRNFSSNLPNDSKPKQKNIYSWRRGFITFCYDIYGQNLFDGYKEIWVKRKEADIQKNLQENLVAVETQAFSGKMQIIRSMLSKYTNDFEKYIKI